jgi:hypothetical protein
MKPSRLTRIGLIPLCLLLSLTACGDKRGLTSIPTPPDHLLADCPETAVAILVNRDLTTKINTLKADLGNCNADKAALREWKKQVSK